MPDLTTVKQFSPWYLLAMAVGAMIGPWVVMMQWWLQLSGPSMSVAFALLGVLCIPIALVYGEMTAMLPVTGGPFQYTHTAFGKHVAFWSTWMLLLAYLSVLGFLIMCVIQIVQYLWWPGMSQTQLVIFGIIVAFVVWLLATRSIEFSSRAQFFMTIVMVLVAAAVVLTFVFSSRFSTANWHPFFPTGRSGFFTATALMVTMYFGFELVPQFVQECNYPARKFWKIIVGSLLFTIVFYSILPLVDSGMAPWDKITGYLMVDANIAGQTFGRWFEYIIMVAALLAILTTLNGFWLASSRILYSMGKARILPKWFDNLNDKNVPTHAALVILGVCIFFMVASGTNWLAALLALMSVGLGIAYFMSSLAFIELRRKHPDWARPFKLPVGYLLGVLAVLVSFGIFYYSAKYLTRLMWEVFVVYCVLGAVIWIIMLVQASREPDEYNVPAVQGVLSEAELEAARAEAAEADLAVD
jgi:basic amino acid/polyamine antiporter, APA family